MAAILRVKRRLHEDPADTLVLQCKRLKYASEKGLSNDEEDGALTSSFKFAGTISEEESTSVTKHIRDAIRKEKLQDEYKRHRYLPDITSKARQAKQQAAAKSRYKVIAKKRALDLDGLDRAEGDESNKENEAVATDTKAALNAEEVQLVNDDVKYHLYDVIQEDESVNPGPTTSADTVTCNGVAMLRENISHESAEENVRDGSVDENFVYDLYYMNRPDFDFRALENIIAIEAFNEELMYDEYRSGDAEICDDDDDSNDEDNWRNDYPDEDPRFFENQEFEYFYGDDGCNPEAAFGDEWGLAARIKKELLMDDPEDYYHEDDVSTTEDELDREDEEENGEADSEKNWFPPTRTSYEAYRMKVMQDLNEDESGGGGAT